MPRRNEETKKIRDKTRVKKFVKGFIEHGGNQTDAALEIGGLSRASASQTGYELMKREDVRQEIKRALQKLNIDREWLLRQRQIIVELGMQQAEKGYHKHIYDDEGNKVGKRTEISASDIDKHLSGIERTLEVLEGKDKSINSSTSDNHYHLHLEDQSVPEILEERQRHKSWFDDILDEKDP